MKNSIYFLSFCFVVLFSACIPNNRNFKEKTKQVEAEVFFKSGNNGIFTYNLNGDLKLKNDNLIDYDSTYCGCAEQEPLATNVEAFKIIKTVDLSNNNINQEFDTLQTINY